MKLAAILIAVPLAMASALLGTTAEKATSAATDRHHPVLLELFTSQGCSSCPPADRLAERLTKEPGLLVISRPVTYWDRLGWKDTLAREENTQLQRAYAARGLAGENGVFTPQIVIDGNRAGFVPGLERGSPFVANFTDDPVRIGRNQLAPSMKVSDRR